MSALHPKVRVPAIIGTILTVVLAVLSAASGVPSIAPFVAAAVTLLQTVSGYLTYS